MMLRSESDVELLITSSCNAEKEYVSSLGLDYNNLVTKKYSPLMRQVLLSGTHFILMVCCGMTSGYSAVMLPQLSSSNSTIKVDQSQASWIASTALLPLAPGCILSGLLLEKYGCKTTILISIAPCVSGWLTLVFSNNVPTILIGRFLTGTQAALLGATPAVYLGETSDPKFRGLLLSTIQLGMSSGVLCVHLLGTFFYWKVIAVVCSVLPLVAGVFIVFAFPESPSWLTKKGRFGDAEKAFKWYRGNCAKAKKELKALLGSKTPIQNTQNVKTIKYLMKKEFLRPVFLMCLFLTAIDFSGSFAIVFYSISLIRGVVGEAINEYSATILVDSLRVASAIAACFIINHCKRKTLLILSGIGCGSSAFALSAFLYLSKTYQSLLSSFSVLPLFFIMGHVVFMMIGMAPLSSCLISEVFPLRMRGFGSCVVLGVSYVNLFVAIKTTPAMFDGLGYAGSFFVYGMVVFVGSIVLYVALPETTGAQLMEARYAVENSMKRDNEGVS